MFTTDTETREPSVQPPPEIEATPEVSSQPILPLIDGVPSGGGGMVATLREPATGAPIARVAFATPEDVDRAAESAARGAALWRGTPFEERGKRLRALASMIRDEAREIAELVSREQGKPVVEALTLEVLPALDHLRFMIRHAERYHSGLAVEPRHPLYAHKHAHYLYDAIGVVALVTPTPLPFAIPLIQVAAALAMGNATVLKPSERTPFSGLRVGELCLRAGFPAGVVNVIPGLPEAALRLVAHPRVDKAFVTGSLEAGQTVMATAGCAPRPVVLSLGGKHPSIVAGDADVDRAARGIVWGAMANAGQNCGAVERVFVEESIASRFLDRVLAEVDRLKIGSPQDRVDLGPLISDRRRQEVHGQVVDAVGRGARLLRGGVVPDGPGHFYPPTVLLEPPLDSPLMTEETLGPVLPIVVVESQERAILLANDSAYAMTASGWTRSSERAERMMVGLQAGVVTINDVLYSFGEPASTWSGFRRSGMGQNHGTPGLREMSRQKFVSFDSMRSQGSIFSFPYDDTADRVAWNALQFLHAKSAVARWRAVFNLAKIRRFRRRVPVRWVMFPGKGRGK